MDFSFSIQYLVLIGSYTVLTNMETSHIFIVWHDIYHLFQIYFVITLLGQSLQYWQLNFLLQQLPFLSPLLLFFLFLFQSSPYTSISISTVTFYKTIHLCQIFTSCKKVTVANNFHSKYGSIITTYVVHLKNVHTNIYEQYRHFSFLIQEFVYWTE